jgi:hypothetical protein
MMPSDFKSSGSDGVGPEAPDTKPVPPGWLKVGAVAAASAVLGGMAAAWFYRKTLAQLREAEHKISASGSKIIEDESPEDF